MVVLEVELLQMEHLGLVQLDRVTMVVPLLPVILEVEEGELELLVVIQRQPLLEMEVLEFNLILQVLKLIMLEEAVEAQLVTKVKQLVLVELEAVEVELAQTYPVMSKEEMEVLAL